MQIGTYGQVQNNQKKSAASMIAKRVFDVVFGAILGVLSLPVILLIAFTLAVFYKKNPFYTQKRGVSLDSPIFTIIKFRTMFKDNQADENPREFILKKNNHAISPFCAWLRKTGLDELPQLINVLKGDMSFIGPRPLSLIDLSTLREYHPAEYAVRSQLVIKPGVSGYWQIFGDRTLGVKNLVEMDAEYASKMNFAFDCFLVWKTIPVMIMAEHSDAVLGGREVEEQKSMMDSTPVAASDMCTVKLNSDI